MCSAEGQSTLMSLTIVRSKCALLVVKSQFQLNVTVRVAEMASGTGEARWCCAIAVDPLLSFTRGQKKLDGGVTEISMEGRVGGGARETPQLRRREPEPSL
jgi:hypothetical protein